ncbi:hypothetical protein [Ruegeria conchae]|nr:hypothetical protein [Ruegeria conchae]
MKTEMVALVAAPFIGVMSSSAAVAEAQVCTVNTARSAANSGDYGSLCDCSHVTPGFIKHLQKRSDLPDILQNTSALCPGLTNLLVDLPTASITGASTGEDRSSDPNLRSAVAEKDEDTGPNAGGGTGAGEGDTPGNGGGEPGDGGDNPGDGGSNPGDGGDKPGKGGDKPGKGGGKGGHGGDKPGKGGAKGNNGGGNGSEGASPGRGKNANNDEG